MGQVVAWPVKLELEGRGQLLTENLALVASLDSGAPEGEKAATLQMLASHRAWRHGGRVVYELAPALTAAFTETGYPLTLEDVKTPHGVFFVSTPGSELTVSNGSQALPVDGMYVTRMPNDVLDIVVVSGSGDMAMCHAQAPTGVEVENWLTARFERNAGFIGEDNASQLVAWVRVVVGLCAYLATESPDLVREPYEQRRAHRDGAGKNAKKLKDVNVSYIRVGTRETGLGEFFAADPETRKLTRRHVVRGHYRRLASGKTTWVRPYWKGPPWAEVAAAAVRKVVS
jgi:hypothetical protein